VYFQAKRHSHNATRLLRDAGRDEYVARVTAAARAATGDPVAVAAYLQCALGRIADTRMLIAAAEQVRADGGPAAGVDGTKPADVGWRETAELARLLREVLLGGRYRPAPARHVAIPKASGSGMRTLSIPTFVDRVVQRAVVTVLQPLLDPSFSPNTFGSRPGKSITDAIARAYALAGTHGLWCWATPPTCGRRATPCRTTGC
jgi:retron-type reverse transcriptase